MHEWMRTEAVVESPRQCPLAGRTSRSLWNNWVCRHPRHTAFGIVIAARKQKAWIICDTSCVRFAGRWKPWNTTSYPAHMILSRNTNGQKCHRINHSELLLFLQLSLAANGILYAISCIFTIALIISYSYYDFMFSLHLFIATYAWGGSKASHKFLCPHYLFIHNYI